MMMFNRVSDKLITKLVEIVGQQNVIIDEENLENYAHDETPIYKSMPEVVVKPTNVSEVSKIIKLANADLVPVTPRGGGTSLSAGAVPLHHGIVLSLERMNRIKEIDTENMMVIVEPGIITGELQKALAKYNLFFPPDPVSLDSCTIGGNIAECAGGPKAMKYGVTKNYVTGLEVVFPDGTISRLGGKLLKNVTGYDLIDLIIGSEGTLAVVTEATLKVLSLPNIIVDLLVPFRTVKEASQFSLAMMQEGLMPSAIEFMDGEVVRMVEKYLNRKVLFSEADTQVIVEVDGCDKETIQKNYNQIGDLALKIGALDVLIAESAKDKERIWEIRKKIGDALKAQIKIVAREDLVVPKNKIPILICQLKNSVKKYGGTLYAFGHLGDGNIHTDVGFTDYTDNPPPSMPDTDYTEKEIRNDTEKIAKMRREMYEITIDLGGTITAEHGIGLSKIDYLPMALDKATIEKMSGIKKIFDPNNILNPGKIFNHLTICHLTKL